MGCPVVHFEVIGTDGKKLRKYYSELFEREIDDANEMNYGVVAREGNTNAEGIGIGGGVAGGPEGYDSRRPSVRAARSSAGTGCFPVPSIAMQT
jgi:predicted enzyme related to lactoylglutathione lyase